MQMTRFIYDHDDRSWVVCDKVNKIIIFILR